MHVTFTKDFKWELFSLKHLEFGNTWQFLSKALFFLSTVYNSCDVCLSV